MKFLTCNCTNSGSSSVLERNNLLRCSHRESFLYFVFDSFSYWYFPTLSSFLPLLTPSYPFILLSLHSYRSLRFKAYFCTRKHLICHYIVQSILFLSSCRAAFRSLQPGRCKLLTKCLVRENNKKFNFWIMDWKRSHDESANVWRDLGFLIGLIGQSFVLGVCMRVIWLLLFNRLTPCDIRGEFEK